MESEGKLESSQIHFGQAGSNEEKTNVQSDIPLQWAAETHTHVTIPPRSIAATATSFLIELPKVKYPVARTIAAFAPQISSSPSIGLLVICRAEWSWTTYSMDGLISKIVMLASLGPLKVNLTIVCRTKKECHQTMKDWLSSFLWVLESIHHIFCWKMADTSSFWRQLTIVNVKRQ